jgi:rare lipoprotein A (peptidoglycan hydrolase)
VRLERFDYRAGRWIVATRARADANGVFLARWRTDHIGRFKIRAFVNQHARAQTAASSPYIRVTVFREVRATWYGPGFFGRRMACGGRLTHRTLGVAHPRLRCGTPVDLVYRGRRLTVPVVDRGPYANRASFDLTFATARALGFRHTDQIGAVSRRVRRR